MRRYTTIVALVACLAAFWNGAAMAGEQAGEGLMPRDNAINEWLDTYKTAWQEQDADLVGTLFSDDAHYAVNPLEQILAGRSAIEDYWRAGAAGSQKDILFDYEVWSDTQQMTIVHWTASFTRAASGERVNMDGVFRLVFETNDARPLLCARLEEWWFLAVDEQSAAPTNIERETLQGTDMRLSLKTKISTPLFDETIAYYKAVFGMEIAQEWDKDDDKGAILVFADGRNEAFLEVYYDARAHDFSGLSLQFRLDDLNGFVETLPPSIDREGPRPRPWGSTYLYLRDPNDIMVIVYEGGM